MEAGSPMRLFQPRGSLARTFSSKRKIIGEVGSIVPDLDENLKHSKSRLNCWASAARGWEEGVHKLGVTSHLVFQELTLGKSQVSLTSAVKWIPWKLQCIKWFVSEEQLSYSTCSPTIWREDCLPDSRQVAEARIFEWIPSSGPQFCPRRIIPSGLICLLV